MTATNAPPLSCSPKTKEAMRTYLERPRSTNVPVTG